jgi:NAD+ kinase
MLFALYNRAFEPQALPLMQYFFKLLQEKKVSICIFKDFYERLQPHITFDQEPLLFTGYHDLNRNTDVMMSLGGDGTMLDAVCYIGDLSIPIIGINLGRLGFLADVQENEIDVAVEALINGAYTIDKRSLLHLDANVPLFGDSPFALNEFTLHRKDSSSMIKIHTYLNGAFLNTYWADGLIVSTPTGSTGYSLSCNGPLIFPQTSSFVITPVAPHNLNIRPIVVPDDNVISFEVEGRTDTFLCTLDSRVETITKDVFVAIKKEKFMVNLIRLDEHNFLKTIRQKLYWGIDSRN